MVVFLARIHRFWVIISNTLSLHLSYVCLRAGVVSLVFSAVLSSGNAAEVDSFTNRDDMPDDSLMQLNREVNARLDQAVAEANLKADRLLKRRHPKTKRRLFSEKVGLTFCNESYLVGEIENHLAGAIIGELEQWVEDSTQIDKRIVAYSDSIYQDFLFDETPSIAGSERISSVIVMGGFQIGSDKFGHFFTEGRSYYERVHAVDGDLEDALKFGERSEIVYFGSLTTGVYSYADLAANLNGLRFWNALLGQFNDPLTQQPSAAYVVCKSKHWQKVREFDWKEYIDVSWDEGVNCSQFRSPMLLEKVQQRMLNKKTCPLENHREEELRAKYQQYFDRIVNLQGHSVLHEDKQAYTLIDQYIKSEEGQRKPNWVIKWLVRLRDKLKLLNIKI